MSSATRRKTALGKRRIKGDKVDMEVEDNKLEPRGSGNSANDFPDLTGDGKITMADILKGRGVTK